MSLKFPKSHTKSHNNNTTYVKLFLAILKLLFIILSYFTLHYLQLFMVKETLFHYNYLNSIIVLIWWCHLALGIVFCE
jgi:hypothetical protein